MNMLPVAVVFSQHAIMSVKTTKVAPSNPLTQREEQILMRAGSVTTVLKGIEGYDHGGLNE